MDTSANALATPLHFRFWPKGLPREIEIPRTSLCANLDVAAQRYPDQPFIIYYGATLTFGRMHAEVEALAGYLQRRCAVARGHRVLLYMQNSPQFVIAYYAILRADAMVVPVNPMNLTDELRHCARDSESRVVLCGQELFAALQPLLGAEIDHVVTAAYGDYADLAGDIAVPDVVRDPCATFAAPGVVSWAQALAAGYAPAPAQAGPDDLCVMPYTSGTTGRPKGCIHTHATTMSTIAITAAWFGGHQDNVVLGTLPLFHVTGMQSSMNTPIYLGSTVVLMTRWDRDTAAKLIERYRVEGWTNISTMAIDFLSNPKLRDYDLSSLQRIGGGGAAMPEAVARTLKDETGLDYIEGYGLSETIAPTHINPSQRPKRQCLGIPICNTDARVIHPETREVLGPNEVGEIVASGPQIFKGYWKNAAATAECFIELGGRAYFRTGDLGRYDEDGYFFIVDRLKRMINASGYKVWPAEVEAFMYAHPDVQEACVIGTNDPHRGETVKALLVLKAAARGNVSPEELIGWCREHMAAYKIPRVIEFVDTLPKSATGKIQWRDLQERERARVS